MTIVPSAGASAVPCLVLVAHSLDTAVSYPWSMKARDAQSAMVGQNFSTLTASSRPPLPWVEVIRCCWRNTCSRRAVGRVSTALVTIKSLRGPRKGGSLPLMLITRHCLGDALRVTPGGTITDLRWPGMMIRLARVHAASTSPCCPAVCPSSLNSLWLANTRPLPRRSWASHPPVFEPAWRQATCRGRPRSSDALIIFCRGDLGRLLWRPKRAYEPRNRAGARNHWE